MNNVDLRILLLSAVMLIGMSALGFAPQALAQDAADSEDSQEIEEIIVTGSRLVRTGFDTPSPVIVIGTDEIGAGTSPALGDLLNRLATITDYFRSK